MLNVIKKQNLSRSLINGLRNVAIREVHTPRRALMYVPSDDKRKLRKSRELEADCIALDLEDGVANNKKDAARQIARAFFDAGSNNPVEGHKESHRRAEWAVRVNSVCSNLCEEDLKTILGGEIKPETILLPKYNETEQLRQFADWVNKALADAEHKINLIFYAESCKAVMRLPELCEYAVQLSQVPGAKFIPVSIVFGSDDFCASAGLTRTEEGKEILYARQRIVTVAKAFDLQAIDMVYTDYTNLEGLKAQAKEGAKFGYTGKQVIHPCQLEIVQKAFVPSSEKVEWASELLKAWDEHEKDGVGAFTFKNKMIDAPTMKQAQNILEIMRSVQ
ncbi:citramalyl-CoA lyase, mitochondrial-like [Culicoides brevitarsis]|uniref:citramalyl-CoA lyase, mitochondrial-like n=1 Tax=Culicoides brevitarsis TaxID=469753 RepID=UPI00307BE7CD